MTPGVLAWATGSMELAFTEMEKSEGGAGFKKNFFFLFLEGMGLGVQF